MRTCRRVALLALGLFLVLLPQFATASIPNLSSDYHSIELLSLPKDRIAMPPPLFAISPSSVKRFTQLAAVSSSDIQEITEPNSDKTDYYGPATAKPSLEVRSGPDNSFPVVSKLKNGTQVLTVSLFNGFYQLKEGGWIQASQTKEVSSPIKSAPISVFAKPGTEIRSGPSATSPVTGRLKIGSNIKVVSFSKGFYQLEKGGWISASQTFNVVARVKYISVLAKPSLEVRSDPDNSFPIVGKLKNGTKVLTLSFSNGFYQLADGGWIQASQTREVRYDHGGAGGGGVGLSPGFVLIAAVDREFERLPVGKTYHNVPNRMQVGVGETIESGIVLKLTDQLKKEIQGKGKIVTQSGVPFNPNSVEMKLLVNQGEFRKTEIKAGKQPITNKLSGQWIWQITPLKPGKHLIILEKTTQIKMPKSKDTYSYKSTVFKGIIEVESNWKYSSGEFVKQNWKEFTTFVVGSGSLAGILSWWIGQRKKA